MNKTENKLVPELRFPEFINDGGWKTKKLKELGEINPKNSNLPISFTYIDLESVIDGVLIKKNKVSSDKAPSRAQRILKKEDILFQMVRPYQKNNFFFKLNGNYVASTGYAQIRTKQNSQFIFQYLHNQNFVDKVIEKCTGTSYPAINSTDLSEIKLPVPSLEEQQKIADFLSFLDEVIINHNDKLEALKNHKKGLLQNLFPQEDETVPKYRFPEFKNDGEWKKIELDKLTHSISSGKDKNSIEGKYKLYGSTGIIGTSNTPSYSGHFILVARVGANAGLLNKVSGNFGVTDNTLVIHLKKLNTIDFIFYSLEKTKLNNLVFGSGQPLITGSQLKNLKLLLPNSEKEQQKIAECLSEVDNLITAQTNKIEQLKAHKKGLMQRLFPNI